MKHLIPLLALALISACTPSTQSALEKVCGAKTIAYIVYVGVKDNLSAARQHNVETANEIASDVCANPPKDTASALQTVSRALATISGSI